MTIILSILGWFGALPGWLKKLGLAVSVGAVLWIAGDIHGHRVEKAKWEAKEKAAIVKADRTRTNAENLIPQLTDQDRRDDDARIGIGKPCVVYDKFDRDCVSRLR